MFCAKPIGSTLLKKHQTLQQMEILDEPLSQAKTPEQRVPEVGNRLAMMVLDHIIFSTVSAMILLPFWFVFIFSTIKEGGPNPATGAKAVFGGLQIVMVAYIFIIAFYLCKDVINGRSPAKRIIGARVISMSTGETATPMRCMLRNITLLFWPIEALLALITSDRRRLGDYLAGTRVVMQAPDNPAPALNWGSILMSYLLATGLLALAILPFYFLTTVLQSKSLENLEKYKSFDDGDTSDTTTLASEMDESLTSMMEPVLADYLTYVQVQTVEQSPDNYVVDISGSALLDDLMNDEEQLNTVLETARNLLEDKLPEASLPVKGRLVIRSADPDSKEMRILSF